MCKVPIKTIHCRMAMYSCELRCSLLSLSFLRRADVIAKGYVEVSLILSCFITCLIIPIFH